MLRRRYGMAARLSAPTFCPFTITEPAVGRSIAAISLSSVDLPAPDRPVRKAISPASSAKVTCFNASWPPGYRLATAEKLTNQRLGESARREGAQVVDPFADPDEEKRHRLFLRDRAHHAALCRAVELREDEAGQAERGIERLHLRERVLTGIRIEYQ